jgi:hypothetical protein
VFGTAVSRHRCLNGKCISAPGKSDRGYSSMTGTTLRGVGVEARWRGVRYRSVRTATSTGRRLPNSRTSTTAAQSAASRAAVVASGSPAGVAYVRLPVHARCQRLLGHHVPPAHASSQRGSRVHRHRCGRVAAVSARWSWEVEDNALTRRRVGGHAGVTYFIRSLQ